MRTLSVFVVGSDGKDGRKLGTVTIGDAGELEFSNDVVKHMLTNQRARWGDAAAFELYADWSNGCVRSQKDRST